MNELDYGLIGAIVGTVIGIIGGLTGTYFSITRTQSPRERSFMMKLAVVTWIGITIFITAQLLIPPPWRHLLWLPYSLALPAIIVLGNRQQAMIRASESSATSK